MTPTITAFSVARAPKRLVVTVARPAFGVGVSLTIVRDGHRLRTQTDNGTSAIARFRVRLRPGPAVLQLRSINFTGVTLPGPNESVMVPARGHSSTLGSALPTAPSDGFFRGGTVTSSSGETFTLVIADGWAMRPTDAQHWAERLSALPHLPGDYRDLRLEFVPRSSLTHVCSSDPTVAIEGCYQRYQNAIVLDGELPRDELDSVSIHEVGHLIAAHRVTNDAPLVPPLWATHLATCTLVANGTMNNDGGTWQSHPAEAWADTYRLMVDARTGAHWADAWTFPALPEPDDAILALATQDVLQPPRPTVTTLRVRLDDQHPTATGMIAAPLDGPITIQVKASGKTPAPAVQTQSQVNGSWTNDYAGHNNCERRTIPVRMRRRNDFSGAQAVTISFRAP